MNASSRPTALTAAGFDPSSGRWIATRRTQTAAVERLTLVTYNIWFGEHRWRERLAHLLGLIARCEPDVVALQEVTPRQLEQILAAEWVRSDFLVSDVSGTTLRPHGVLLLSRLPIHDITLCRLPSRKDRKLLTRLDRYRTRKDQRRQSPSRKQSEQSASTLGSAQACSAPPIRRETCPTDGRLQFRSPVGRGATTPGPKLHRPMARPVQRRRRWPHGRQQPQPHALLAQVQAETCPLRSHPVALPGPGMGAPEHSPVRHGADLICNARHLSVRPFRADRDHRATGRHRRGGIPAEPRRQGKRWLTAARPGIDSAPRSTPRESQPGCRRCIRID